MIHHYTCPAQCLCMMHMTTANVLALEQLHNRLADADTWDHRGALTHRGLVKYNARELRLFYLRRIPDTIQPSKRNTLAKDVEFPIGHFSGAGVVWDSLGVASS